MSTEHGEFGNENRKFLPSLYRSPKQQLMMKLYSNDPLPSKVDFREKYKVQIYNQGSTNSCTANALGTAYAIRTIVDKKAHNPIYLSRLFIYYNERKKINQTNQDQGAFIKDGVKTLKEQGGCLESLYPFDITKVLATPPPNCYIEALNHTSESAEMDPSDYVNQFKIALSKDIPVICGVMVYQSFQTNEVGKTGIIPYPDINKEKLEGGHAICIIGYDDSKSMFIFQNSWDTVWGDQGYGYIPYSYIANPFLTADCHILTDTEIKKSNPIPIPTPPQPKPRPKPQPRPNPYYPNPFQPIPHPFPYPHPYPFPYPYPYPFFRS